MTRTIHEWAKERVELAMTYAEDGAFHSAARIFREVANKYESRVNEVEEQAQRERNAEIDYRGHSDIPAPDVPKPTIDDHLTNISWQLDQLIMLMKERG